MPKRAVMMSFELWKEWITQDAKFTHIECITGIPKDAVLLGTFFGQQGGIEVPELVMVFESSDFEPVKDGEYLVTAPDGTKFATFTPVFHQRYPREEYNVISWREGDKKRKISIKSTDHSVVLFDWEPDHGQGSSPWGPDESCKYEVEFLC